MLCLKSLVFFQTQGIYQSLQKPHMQLDTEPCELLSIKGEQYIS